MRGNFFGAVLLIYALFNASFLLAKNDSNIFDEEDLGLAHLFAYDALEAEETGKIDLNDVQFLHILPCGHIQGRANYNAALQDLNGLPWLFLATLTDLGLSMDDLTGSYRLEVCNPIQPD